MSVNTSIGMIGVAKQAAKGTAATQPTFVHGLTGGQVFQLDMSIEADDVACGIRTNVDSHRESIVPGADFETYGYADVLPLYYYAALGAIASAAGSTSGTYKHTITVGDLLPYLTVWGRIGTDNVTKVEGCKVDEIEMEFEGNNPMEFGVTMMGMLDTLGLSAIPGSVDPACFDGYFVPTGGTFKVATASDTPVEAPITAGALTLANACEAAQYAGQVKPGDVTEGKLTASGSVTVKPDDMALYRAMITGSAAGTTSTGDMVYGSFEWNFKHSKNADWTMKVTALHVPFTADYPDVDPGGGAAEIQFSFDNLGIASATDSPVTIEIVNGVESYA